MSHDTYIVLVPSAGTVRARCSCGWAGDEHPVRDFSSAENDEIGHIAEALYELEGTDAVGEEADG